MNAQEHSAVPQHPTSPKAPLDDAVPARLEPPASAYRGPGLDDAVALGKWLAPHEQWRLYRELRDQARFIDIETLGLALDDAITLVGISDGTYASVLVSGRDLCARRLADALFGARLLVTFNGTSFDLPRLRRAFPGLPWHLPHVDLAIAGRHVGLRGGLKAIERRLGWRRPRAIAGDDGAAAVRLWRAHQAGDRRALPRLIRYCREDVASLVSLADVVTDRLARQASPGDLGWIEPSADTLCVLPRDPWPREIQLPPKGAARPWELKPLRRVGT